MDRNSYQSITNIKDVFDYIDDMDGFRDFPIGSINYDDKNEFFSAGIEEIIDGEDWPEESSGRVWFLNFNGVSTMRFDIDIPSGLWISDIYPNNDGSITIECKQGSITILAESTELAIPIEKPEEEQTQDGIGSYIAETADEAPLNAKNLFNDIKNVVKRKQDEFAEESTEPVAIAEPQSSPSASPTVPSMSPVAPTPAPTPTSVAPQPQTPSVPVASPTPTQPQMPAPTPAAATLTQQAQPANPFLNDPNFVPLQPTTSTPPPKAPNPPVDNPIFS